MKKFVIIAAMGALMALPAGNAMAQGSGAGCGVGTMIFEGQSGVLPQILAVTTNGTLGNQTFGISSGTLGCQQDGVVLNEHERSLFAEANFEQIKKDMAVGGGEYLETLASLMGVESTDQARFNELAQSGFATLVTSSEATFTDLLANLDAAMKADPALSRYAL